MGKSSKKSTPKVEATPAVAPPQSGEKAEETLEKQVAPKKQKKTNGLVQAILKKKVEAKTQKKKKKKDSEDASTNKVSAASKRPLPTAGIKQKSDDSKDDSSDETEDEQPTAKKSKVASDSGKDAKVVKKVSSSEEEESEKSSDDDQESEEEGAPNKKPQTPATPQVQHTGSRTLFVGNLPFQVEQADIKNFFKDAGEIVDIRLSTDHEGNFKGYGHVEFATAEAAQKALELNGEYLINRSVRLDFARERGEYTPHSSDGNNSFQKGGKGQARTIFVKGFDQSLGEDEIKKSLEEHFGSCGEISRVAIPVDRETGAVKGYAYLDFNDGDSFNKALELDGSEINNYSVSVEAAKPRGESRDGPGRGRGGGGRGGGRGGRRGGGRFGGAGRGRGKH